MNPPPVFRFAPSPNGYLHLGHARSALLNARMAREAGGHLLLRIEDIDTTRCRPEYATAIDEDLRWLGIEWETPVRRQSEHLDVYRDAIAKLERAGLIYPSFESRSEIAQMVAARERAGAWPRDPDGAPLYPGDAKSLPLKEREKRMQSEPYALRLDMQAAIERAGPLTWRETGADRGVHEIAAAPEAWGDVVIARKEIPTSYHISVVIDDALQGVTHVVRGRDLYHATGIHRLLQTLFGLTDPLYHHHPLMLDEAGEKLSKATKATALRDLRAQGLSPEDVRALAGF